MLDVEERVRRLVTAVTTPGPVPPVDVLRTAYREQLLGIAALDVTAPDPTSVLPETAAALADLAQAALEAALAIARERGGAGCRPHPPRGDRAWARPAGAS